MKGNHRIAPADSEERSPRDEARTSRIRPNGKLALASARRRESRMLRRLGRLALQALAQRGSLDLQDSQVRPLCDDLIRVDREIGFLLDRLKSAHASPAQGSDALPLLPGADTRFPFSR